MVDWGDRAGYAVTWVISEAGCPLRMNCIQIARLRAGLSKDGLKIWMSPLDA